MLVFYISAKLTLTENSRLRVFNNRELRKTFVPDGGEVTGDLRRQHNDYLHDL